MDFQVNLGISLESADFNEIHSHLSDLNRETSKDQLPRKLTYYIVTNEKFILLEFVIEPVEPTNFIFPA